MRERFLAVMLLCERERVMTMRRVECEREKKRSVVYWEWIDHRMFCDKCH